MIFTTTTAVVAIAYDTAADVLLHTGQDRVLGLSRQLASVLENSAHRRMVEAYGVTRRAVIRSAIETPTEAAVLSAREELQTYVKANAQVLGAQLWSVSGRLLVDVTQPAATGGAVAKDTAGPTASGATPFAVSGDVVYYDIVSPVLRAETPHTASAEPTLGYFVLRHHAATLTGAGAGTGSRLHADGGALRLGSLDGGVWTDLATVVAPPPLDHSQQFAESDQGPLAATVALRGTPWHLVVTLPRRVVIAPARAFLERMISFCLVVVVIAGGGAWLIVGRITKPLNELTDAADEIAEGRYRHLVSAPGRGEVARLAEAFNVMTARVHESHERLEERVRERTRELEDALTALSDVQEQLVRREKLAILGQLAGGVGHELRNPLGVMTNAVYYLDMVQTTAPPDVREYHDILLAQIGLAEKIVSDLLDFARVKPPQRVSVPLVAVVKEQLRRLVPPAAIHIAVDFPSDLPMPCVDPVQIGQVVFNLLANAIQAMETHGGTLTLRGRTDHPGTVSLEVSDSGPGVPPELRDKIFEALFTTKPRGIGLGLPVSRTLAESNGGRLRLTGTAGTGATFELDLPAEVAA